MNIHLLFILFLKIKLPQIAIVTQRNWTTSHLHDSRTNSFNKTIDWAVFMLAGLCVYYRFFPPQKGVHTSLCWNCNSLALWCFLFMLAIREVLDGRADSAAVISLEPSVISKLYGSLNSQQTDFLCVWLKETITVISCGLEITEIRKKRTRKTNTKEQQSISTNREQRAPWVAGPWTSACKGMRSGLQAAQSSALGLSWE